MLRLVYSRDDVAPPPVPAVPFVSPHMKPLVDYWRSLRVGTDIPRRTDVDPSRFAPLLAGIAMFEMRGRSQWECRLSGAMLAMFGLERGYSPATLFGGSDRIVACMDLATAFRHPWVVQYDRAEVLLLPLRTMTSAADRMMLVLFPAPGMPVPAALKYQRDRVIRC